MHSHSSKSCLISQIHRLTGRRRAAFLVGKLEGKGEKSIICIYMNKHSNFLSTSFTFLFYTQMLHPVNMKQSEDVLYHVTGRHIFRSYDRQLTGTARDQLTPQALLTHYNFRISLHLLQWRVRLCNEFWSSPRLIRHRSTICNNYVGHLLNVNISLSTPLFWRFILACIFT